MHTHLRTPTIAWVIDAAVFAPLLHVQQHRFTYNEAMPVESTTQSLCDLALRFGEDDEEGGMVRAGGKG
eukprot:1029673-Pelagomonas_calceolata.AAC.1